jgi:hypothetical protein
VVLGVVDVGVDDSDEDEEVSIGGVSAAELSDRQLRDIKKKQRRDIEMTSRMERDDCCVRWGQQCAYRN